MCSPSCSARLETIQGSYDNADLADIGITEFDPSDSIYFLGYLRVQVRVGDVTHDDIQVVQCRDEESDAYALPRDYR